MPRIIQLVAQDRFSGIASPYLPCSPDDQFVFTGTIQYVSGGMRPGLGLWFWDDAFAFKGIITFDAVLTDNGWHMRQAAGTTPAGATQFQVRSECGYTNFDVWALSGGGRSRGVSVISSGVAPPASMIPGAIVLVAGMTPADLNGGPFSITDVNGFNAFYNQIGLPDEVATAFGTATVIGFGNLPTSWNVSDFQILQNGAEISLALGTLNGPVTSAFSEASVQPLYYLSLLTSLYQRAGKMKAWLSAHLSVTSDLSACALSMSEKFDINNAQGAQLDALGQLIGVGRTVPFQPSGGVSPTLDDGTYRIYLKAKIAKNQWDGQLSSMYAIWTSLFPGGIIVLNDNQNMTATIFLLGSFTSIVEDLILNDLIIPRPQAVLYNFVFGDLPAFGFDHDDSFISGFDVGKWN